MIAIELTLLASAVGTVTIRQHKPWLARFARDAALWLRAPAGKRPDWSKR